MVALFKLYEKENRKKEFQAIDRRKILKFSDKELALWQTEFPHDSPQFKLAEHEWNRRLIAEQIKSNRFAALIGILGVVIGIITNYILERVSNAQPESQSICQRCHVEEQSTNIETKYLKNSSNTATNNVSRQKVEPHLTTPNN